ncbi:hypothetical protein V5799_021568 [Amblyomma americanum]|uniref:Uncharacterized protein n=1 Tax=Amblyomma americanum TaxID=6943 RepID=A0AAQ4FPJ7_AMBAM
MKATSMYLLSLPHVWLDVVRSEYLPEWFIMTSVLSLQAQRIVRSSCKCWTRNLSAVEDSFCKRSATITSDMTCQFNGGQLP